MGKIENHIKRDDILRLLTFIICLYNGFYLILRQSKQLKYVIFSSK